MKERIVAVFKCKDCGERAEAVELIPAKGGERNTVSSGAVVYDQGSSTSALLPQEYEPALKAVEAGDAKALHAVHPRYASMYCPPCSGCYCLAHWKREQLPDPNGDAYSMYYDTYGTCPKGHRRLMAKDGFDWPKGA